MWGLEYGYLAYRFGSDVAIGYADALRVDGDGTVAAACYSQCGVALGATESLDRDILGVVNLQSGTFAGNYGEVLEFDIGRFVDFGTHLGLDDGVGYNHIFHIHLG